LKSESYGEKENGQNDNPDDLVHKRAFSCTKLVYGIISYTRWFCGVQNGILSATQLRESGFSRRADREERCDDRKAPPGA
jgi:hypothetical protein